MKYFIYYKKTFIAFADSKQIKNDFIQQFKNRDDFTVDKFKKINRYYLEDDIIDNNKLYFDNNLGIYTSDNIDAEIYAYIQEMNEAMLIHCDRLDAKIRNLRLADNEQYILNQCILHYGFIIEDNETMYSDITDVPLILETYIFPRLEASPMPF